jgi:hypothetical protein
MSGKNMLLINKRATESDTVEPGFRVNEQSVRSRRNHMEALPVLPVTILERESPVMINKTVTSLAFAAGCALALGAMPAAHAQYYQSELVTNGPQASRGDFGDWSARRNVIESAHYDRLLQTSRGFRQARMRKECGPIGDQQLHEQCMASFQEYEPAMVGSSMPPRRYHRSLGY